MTVGKAPITLFEHARQQRAAQGPQPGEIVLQRRGLTGGIHGRVPGGYAEIHPTWDGEWTAILEYSTDQAHYWRAAERASTFDEALKFIYALSAEQGADEYKISAAVEAYCYPPQPGDWFRAAALLRGDEVITLQGEPLARFSDNALVPLCEQWREQVERANHEYQKPFNQRKDATGLWTVWLLGCYMVADGGAFEWRQSLEAAA